MDMQSGGEAKDKRLLVLLALGVGILAASWFMPGWKPQYCDYFLQGPSGDGKVPVVVRRNGRESTSSEPNPEFVRLSATTACSDTPPQLAMFFNLPMPVNRADQASLTMLPGIGPGLAERIVMFRKETGKISEPEALGRINGIGTRLTERLSPMLCFD